MVDLTDDELTVLLIAKEGQSMMPIGRWEKPVKNLAEKGLLTKFDNVNYGITKAGTALAEQRNDDDARAVLELSIRTQNHHEQYRQSVEQAARHLVFAAKAAALATGDDVKQSVRAASEKAAQHAVEMLNE